MTKKLTFCLEVFAEYNLLILFLLPIFYCTIGKELPDNNTCSLDIMNDNELAELSVHCLACLDEHFLSSIVYVTRLQKKNAKDEIYLNFDCNVSEDIPMKINVDIRYNLLALKDK